MWWVANFEGWALSQQRVPASDTCVNTAIARALPYCIVPEPLTATSRAVPHPLTITSHPLSLPVSSLCFPLLPHRSSSALPLRPPSLSAGPTAA